MIYTEEINVVPFDMKYLLDYYHGFNHEITKFQWPDPFENSDNAKDMLQVFLNEMEREETLLFSILSKNDEFLGSVEVHGLTGKCPELGVWIIETAQKKGYAYKALSEVLNYISIKYNKDSFFYEVDVRNIASTNLRKNMKLLNMDLKNQLQLPESHWNCRDIFLKQKSRLLICNETIYSKLYCS